MADHSSGDAGDARGKSAQSLWAIAREDRAIRAAIETHTQTAFAAGDELLGFLARHLRQVVNVQLTFLAMAHTVVTSHLFPARWAGRRHANIVEGDVWHLFPGAVRKRRSVHGRSSFWESCLKNARPTGTCSE